MTEPCDQLDQLYAYALRALAPSEATALEAHLASCPCCRDELDALQPTLDALVAWPTDVLRPTRPLQARLANRIAADSGTEPVLPPPPTWTEPDWAQVAPGIECKLLANDAAMQRVSMLVRLAPGAEYPAHEHAGFEELHLLDGELWIDDRKLYPGDYNRAEPGSSDLRVWSETGCTCVLITSTADRLT